VTKFGEIIVQYCGRPFSSFYFNSTVEFIKQQANEVAHSLEKVAKNVASSQILVDIANYIEYLLINEMP
jgi:hypothetical protein